MHNALLATHWLSIVNSQAWTKKIRYNSIEQTIQVKNLLRHALEYHKVVVSSTNEELGLSNTNLYWLQIWTCDSMWGSCFQHSQPLKSVFFLFLVV